jgi:hypothetical protein
METFKLPQEELSDMIQFYQEEFDRTARRLIHTASILKRLGVKVPEISVPALQIAATLPDTAGSADQEKPKTDQKPGRKSKWELLVMKRMRQLEKPVTYEELTDEILTFLKLGPEKRKSTKQAVVNVVFRLRNRDQKLDTFSVGTKEKYIALKSWFESPGKIKKEYASKVAVAKPPKKTRKRKAGRPRKSVKK